MVVTGCYISAPRGSDDSSSQTLCTSSVSFTRRRELRDKFEAVYTKLSISRARRLKISIFIFDIFAVKLSSEETASRDFERRTENHISYFKMNKVSISSALTLLP